MLGDPAVRRALVATVAVASMLGAVGACGSDAPAGTAAATDAAAEGATSSTLPPDGGTDGPASEGSVPPGTFIVHPADSSQNVWVFLGDGTAEIKPAAPSVTFTGVSFP